MGSSARLDFIDQVLVEHRDELAQEAWESLPHAIKALKPRVVLEPEVDEIERTLAFEGAPGETEYLVLAPLTIFDLEDRYGDPRRRPFGDGDRRVAHRRRCLVSASASSI